MDQKTAILLDDFGAFFREFPDAKRIESGPFYLWFAGFKHPTLPSEAKSVFEQLLRGIDEDVDASIEAGLLARLVAAGAAYEAAELLGKFQAGEDVDLRAGLEAINEKYDQQINRKIKNPQVLTPIEELLNAEANDIGFHWRIPMVNAHIKALRGGDFVVIAGRPDQGKTSFISSELTFMAAQVDTLYPGENRSVLWLNNEGPGGKIIVRTFQSAIGPNGSTIEDMAKLQQQPSEKYGHMLREEYAKAVGGRPGVLRVFDIHGFTNMEVEELIRKYNPAIIVFDMVDNIQFGGSTNNNGQRTDQLLEAMYQWARYMGVKYDAVVMATSQISVDGDNMQWPGMHMLKDSKTGKQGAADVILMIGSMNDPMLATSRYLSTPKNKKGRSGVPSNMRVEVLFDKDRARYLEPPK